MICLISILKPKKLKERNKELVEKCRAYLQRSKDLTVQNRELKDSQDRAMKDNNKLVSQASHSSQLCVIG